MKTKNSIAGSGFLPVMAMVLIAAATARADYQGTVLGDSPLAYYPLNLEVDTGSAATDLSGNNNAGTYVNIYSGFNNVPGPSPYITNGISFDGASTYVDLSTGANPGLLNFSGAIALEAWVQPANSTSFGNVVAKGYDSSTYQEIVVRVNGPYGANYFASSGTAGVSGGQQNTNWTHVVLANDGANTKLYINGVLVQSAADTSGSIAFADPWAIGNGSSAGYGRFFNGNISQVAIYNHSLSSSQVLNHFAVGLVGVPAANAVPIITAQPQPQSTFIGGNVTFSVSTVSALSTTNQWYKNNAPLNGQTNSTLTLNNAQAGDVANYRVVVGNNNGTTNSVTVGLTLLTAGNLLQWTANGNSGVWDVGGSPNWLNLGNNQQVVFSDNDQVLFDDTVGVPTIVTVSGPVSPSVITIDSSANNFTFNSTGPITGSGALVKKGSSTLTLNVPGGFAGPATISGGTVKTEGGGTLASVSSITITNGGTLDFSGQTMGGNKSIILSGAGVGGLGALYNSGNETYDNVLNVTLAADAVIGGSARWDFAAGSAISGAHKLTLIRSSSGAYGEWKSVNIANNVGDIELVTGKLGIKDMGSSFGSLASKLIVDDGFELDFWSGGCNRSIHVRSNGLVQILTALSAFDSNVTLDHGARWVAFWGSGNLPMNGTFTLNGIAHIVLGDANFVFTNVISGSGGFVWDAYNHQMIMSASNTYSGPSIIGDGQAVALTGNGSISQSSLIFFGGNNAGSVHVDVTGRPDQTLTLASGQTLAGVGQVSGKLTVLAGATLSPAGTNTTLGITTGQNATGTFSATGNISLFGTTVIKLNGTGTNDAITSTTGSIACGGTLNLVNVSASPLAAGNSFQILNAGSISGSFANIAPATPGAGLAWNTSQLNTGLISVVAAAQSQPAINNIVISGGNLIFSGTNGTVGSTYYVLSSPDLAAPLSSWTPLLTNTFGAGGTFSITNAINPATPRQFYLLKLP
jgi:Concanavalin A-like lectin/glucanases superfamily